MTGTTSTLENYMLVSTRYDILEMNVVARYKDGVPVYSVLFVVVATSNRSLELSVLQRLMHSTSLEHSLKT